MIIGHACLLKDGGSTGRRLLFLAAALGRQGIHQHVVVRCSTLAGQLSHLKNVTVSPLASSPVAAYCMFPAIDIAHLHDTRSMPVGLLLALTRSIPFITTYTDTVLPPDRAVVQAAYRRASSIVCTTAELARAMQARYAETIIDIVPDVNFSDRDKHDKNPIWQRTAAEYVKIYRRSLSNHEVPAMLL